MNVKAWQWVAGTGIVLFLFQNCGQQEVSFQDLPSQNGKQSVDVPVQQALPDNPEPALGSFHITGVTGGSDSNVDSYLAGSVSPEVHFSSSENAESYNVIISDSSGEVCSASAAATSESVELKNCDLQADTIYSAEVLATSPSQQDEMTEAFEFAVDLSSPVVQLINQLINLDEMSTMMVFSVADNYQVDSISCELVGSSVSVPCDLSNDELMVSLNELAIGEHTLVVSAVDSAGNKTQYEHKWRMELIICDPLNGNSDTCDRGLKGEIYYLSAEQGRKSENKNVNAYFEIGTRVDATLFMSQVNVPDRSYDEGFKLSNGDFVRDENGNMLTEYFAMKLNSFLKLSDSDEEGYYAFSVNSDDGSILSINDGELVVNNDGQHGPLTKCSSNAIYMKKGDVAPMQLKYYQGPRTQIALVLSWKKVNPGTYSMRECDSSKGWQVLAPDNFIVNK